MVIDIPVSSCKNIKKNGMYHIEIDSGSVYYIEFAASELYDIHMFTMNKETFETDMENPTRVPFQGIHTKMRMFLKDE